MRYSNSTLEIFTSFLREHKIVGKIIALMILFVGLLICWEAGSMHEFKNSNHGQVVIPNSMEEMEKDYPYLAITEMDSIATESNATVINLSETNNGLEITSGGDYILTGSLDGMVHIVAKEQNVHLFLNGVDIVSKSGSAIYCEEADKLIITLCESSENVISDSGDYREYNELEACIYAECDMTFNGTGSLTVNGYYKDAIRSKDIVKILDGEYSIKCKRTGVHGNDGILVSSGEIMISSKKNGFKTTKKGSEGRGMLIISGGDISVIAGRYAFVTTKADIIIYDCVIHDRSIVDTYDCGGVRHVQEGCVR